MVNFACPNCMNLCSHTTPGEKVLCPKCGQKIFVPSPPIPPPQNQTVFAPWVPPPSPLANPQNSATPPLPDALNMADILATTANDSRTSKKSAHEKYCYECGAAIRSRAEICPRCGVRQPDDPLERGRGRLEPHRATTLLVLGIIGFFTIPFVFGPMAWFMAKEDLEKMDKGVMDPTGRSSTEMGKLLGIINTVWSIVVLASPFFVIFMFWGICCLGAAARPHH